MLTLLNSKINIDIAKIIKTSVNHNFLIKT